MITFFFGSILLFLTTTFNSLEGSNLPQCHNQFDIDYGSLDNFTDHMCLYCLDTMINRNSPAWRNSNIVNNEWTIDILHKGNQILIHNIHNQQTGSFRLSFRELEEAVKRKGKGSHFILKQFISQYYMNTFLDCCQDAYDCCRRMSANPGNHGLSHHCPTHWDGWSCWESAPAGRELQTCPDMTEYLFGYLPPRYARNNAVNVCEANGQWHKRFNTYYNRSMGHADYRECSSLKIEHASAADHGLLKNEGGGDN